MDECDFFCQAEGCGWGVDVRDCGGWGKRVEWECELCGHPNEIMWEVDADV